MQTKAKNVTIFWFGVVPALFFQVVGAYIYFIAYADSGFANWIYSAVKVLILTWPLLWLWLGFRAKKFGDGNFWRSVLWGCVSGILILAAAFGLYFAFRDFFDGFAPDLLAKVEDFSLQNYYIPFAIFLSVVHSLIEEYFWRWFVFRGLMLKMAFWPAAIISGIAFASHHFIVVSQFFGFELMLVFGSLIAVGGVFWCWLYKKTDNILASWISHFWVDVAVMSIGYLIMFT